MKRLILIAAIGLLCAGCTSDLYYAASFISKFERGKESATEKIYVCMPKEVIHTNSSLNDIAGFMFMSDRELDSVVASKTRILDKIDDSVFLAQFNEAFLFTLSRLRVPIVVVDDERRLPAADDQHFVVDVVQIEAEEYVEPCQSKFQTRKGMLYSYDYELRHFATNVWLKLDGADTNAAVYFKNAEVAEDFHGTVTSLKNDKATLKTHFDRIDVNDAYRVARRLGSLCATLYVEKLLTEYVCRQKGTNSTYFFYDAGMNAIEDLVPYDDGMKDSFEKL